MVQQIYEGLIDFIKTYTTIDSNNIRQGFQNRTGLSKGDFCLLSYLNSITNMRPIMDVLTGEQTQHSELLTATFQLDFYGDNAYTNASKIKTLLFDYIGCNFLDKYNIQPLECSDIINHTGSTFINEQYYKRYSIDVKVNYYNDVLLQEQNFNNVILSTNEVSNDN